MGVAHACEQTDGCHVRPHIGEHAGFGDGAHHDGLFHLAGLKVFNQPFQLPQIKPLHGIHNFRQAGVGFIMITRGEDFPAFFTGFFGK